jgi:hypothetical protein
MYDYIYIGFAWKEIEMALGAIQNDKWHANKNNNPTMDVTRTDSTT